ncbi:MAG: Ldh family oxidoreductase [Betaproteobacteria bacterium]|nr:Ldh family oxidoreductase [Betaproteobacteria bacterium]
MVIVSASDSQAFIERALVAHSVRPEDALTTAELMTQADLQGADGHGIFRLPQYIARIRAGGINVEAKIHVQTDHGATALVNGDNALGHLVARKAALLAIEKAGHFGLGWVGTRMSNHAGPASLYARMISDAGLIGIYIAVGSANHMAPWGGTDLLLSTNPIAIAVPNPPSPPVLLDMATTVAAYGKVKLKAQAGEQMPVGWMIDKRGAPLTDPQRAKEGLLLPIGEHKGYGLSLLIGILAGTLNGAAMGSQVVDFNNDQASITNTGQSALAIDPAAFGPVESFRDQLNVLLEEIRSSQRLPGVSQIRIPGEGSAQMALERRSKGIPLQESLLKQLNTLAKTCNIDPIIKNPI